MPWTQRAACNGTPDPDAFFPDPDDWATPRPWAALALCAVCVVASACLRVGYLGREHGLWGGTTESERDLLRLTGWQPGQPLPLPAPVRWVPLGQAARELGISREVVGVWARTRQVDSRPGRAPTGQPCRLVRVDQVAARAARARLPQAVRQQQQQEEEALAA